MRSLLSIAMLFAYMASHGQSYYIPYVSGGKVGLVNEKGEKIIPCTYDNMTWEGGGFLRAERQVVYNDTLHLRNMSYSRNHNEARQYSLIFKGKEIISRSPYRYMDIVGQQLILARISSASDIAQEMLQRFPIQEENTTTLFNVKGQLVDSTAYQEVKVLDTVGKSLRSKGNPRYALLRMTDHNNRHTLILFDLDKEKPAVVCCSKVRMVEILSTDHLKQEITFFFTGEDSRQEAYALHYGQAKPTLLALPQSAITDEVGVADYPVPVARNYSPSGGSDPAGMGSAGSTTQHSPDPELRLVHDTVYYFPSRYSNDNRRLHYALHPGQRIVLSSDFSYFIYEENKKYGLITLSGAGEAKYDMLRGYAYHVEATLAGKTGIMDPGEKILLSMVYDSLVFDLGRMMRWYGTLQIKPQQENLPFYRSRREYIITYKDGKAGLFRNDYVPVLPVAYDYIAVNGIYAQERLGKENKYLAKKNKLYYAFDELSPDMAEPKLGFEYIPLYKINDYYGVKGFRVYALYDDNGRFKGYVSASGKKFYE